MKKKISIGLLLLVLGALGVGAYMMHNMMERGFSTRTEPMQLEKALATTIRGQAIPSRKADRRIWRMAAHDLVILFKIVESSKLVADLICELHEGTSVTLPGYYSAAQLVLLGYSIPVRKPPRPVNLPGNRYVKHTA